MRPPRKTRRTRRAISHASYSSLRGRQPAWQTARALGHSSLFAPDHEQDTGLSKLWDLEIELAGSDQEAARKAITEACQRFLTNPVIEDFTVEIL